MIGWWRGILLGSAVFLTTIRAVAADPAAPRVIGIEGNVQVTLARGDYQPKPLDDRSPLVLRIEKITPVDGAQFRYDFHYIGFEPGSYKLEDYLIRPDGTATTELADVPVVVRSTLPSDHNGALNSFTARPFPWFGGYRMLLAGLAGIWVLGLAAFMWFGRRRNATVTAVAEVPAPTYAERMLPLVEAAATGALTADGQAELERLMTGYWREKLVLAEERMADTLAALKRSPEAGALLLALERWLHHPGGAYPGEVERLLEPYRHLPVALAKEVHP